MSKQHREHLTPQTLKGCLRLIPVGNPRKNNLDDTLIGPPKKRRRLDQSPQREKSLSMQDVTRYDDDKEEEKDDEMKTLGGEKEMATSPRPRKRSRVAEDDVIIDLVAEEDALMSSGDMFDPFFEHQSVAVQEHDVIFSSGMFDALEHQSVPVEEDCTITDVRFDMNVQYDDSSEICVPTKRDWGVSHGRIDSSMLEPKKRQRRKKDSSSQKNCKGSDCEHSLELMRLKRDVRERYVLVPRNVYLQMADDRSLLLNWWSPMHVSFLMDLQQDWLYAIFLASGSFRLKGVNVCLGRHELQFNGYFFPGHGNVKAVCCFFCKELQHSRNLILWGQLTHVSSTVPPRAMKAKPMTLEAPINPNTKVVNNYTRHRFDCDGMMIGRGYCKLDCKPSAAYVNQSISKSKVCESLSASK